MGLTSVEQTIGAEIAAHEVTVEDMRRRNVANLPPSTADGKAARGGTMLDQLQVTLTPTGAYWELQEIDVGLPSALTTVCSI